jgi:hypothetical protein
MTQDPLTEKLEKAAGNVARLRQFFVARRTWKLADDAETTAEALIATASQMDDRLKQLLTTCGARSIPPARSDAEPLPDGELDKDRLGRFASFLRDLDAWFAAQPKTPNEAGGIAALQRMEACVAQTIGIMTSIAPVAAERAIGSDEAPEETASGPTEAPVPETPAARPPTEREQAANVESVASSQPDPTGSGEPPTQLVLDDRDERPMLQEFRNMLELTPDCVEQVSRFLSAHGIKYEGYALKKFHERLLRWIDSAPDGQVLVLKISHLKEPHEPYPSYVSREVLQQGKT